MNIKRKCISCKELKNRSEMIKITKDYCSGNVVIESNSKIFGRSAYLCYNQECIDEAFRKKRINKALKTNVNIDKKILEDLMIQNLKGTTDGQFKS